VRQSWRSRYLACVQLTKPTTSVKTQRRILYAYGPSAGCIPFPFTPGVTVNDLLYRVGQDYKAVDAEMNCAAQAAGR
jgi:hypothetical protein